MKILPSIVHSMLYPAIAKCSPDTKQNFLIIFFSSVPFACLILHSSIYCRLRTFEFLSSHSFDIKFPNTARVKQKLRKMISDETLILDVLLSFSVLRSFASHSHFFFMKITHETISNVLTENIAPNIYGDNNSQPFGKTPKHTQKAFVC